MFGANMTWIENEWKPYFEAQMDYLKVPASVDTSKFLNKSIDILNNDSYEKAVAFVKSLTRKKVMSKPLSSNIYLYAIGGGLLAASLFFLRKS